MLSALNPLQYLPVVGMIYRAATGDEGSPMLRAAVSLVSGAVLGGPFGLIAGALSVVACQGLHLDRWAESVLQGVASAGSSMPSAPPGANAAIATRDRVVAPAGITSASAPAAPTLASPAAPIEAAPMPTMIPHVQPPTPAPLAATVVAAYHRTMAG